MVRRILLALSFVAALGVAGFGFNTNAEAHGGGCYRGGYGGYGGYGGGYYGAYYPSYYGGWGYGPRTSYYRGYGGHRGHRHHGHSGFYLSIGF